MSVDLKSFKKHRPTDPSDPGFTIPGARLRWISGRVRERSDSSGLWITFRKEKMPKELIEHVENHYPGAFSSGDTVRRGNGELVLAYTDVALAANHRKEIDKATRDQSSRARIMPSQENVGKRDYAKIEEYEESAGSIPSQFLNKKKSE